MAVVGLLVGWFDTSPIRVKLIAWFFCAFSVGLVAFVRLLMWRHVYMRGGGACRENRGVLATGVGVCLTFVVAVMLSFHDTGWAPTTGRGEGEPIETRGVAGIGVTIASGVVLAIVAPRRRHHLPGSKSAATIKAGAECTRRHPPQSAIANGRPPPQKLPEIRTREGAERYFRKTKPWKFLPSTVTNAIVDSYHPDVAALMRFAEMSMAANLVENNYIPLCGGRRGARYEAADPRVLFIQFALTLYNTGNLYRDKVLDLGDRLDRSNLQHRSWVDYAKTYYELALNLSPHMVGAYYSLSILWGVAEQQHEKALECTMRGIGILSEIERSPADQLAYEDMLTKSTDVGGIMAEMKKQEELWRSALRQSTTRVADDIEPYETEESAKSQVAATLRYLDIVGELFGAGFESSIVDEYVEEMRKMFVSMDRERVMGFSKVLAEEQITPRQWVVGCIMNRSANEMESGKHHVYRGVLGTKGGWFKSVFERSIELLVDMDVCTATWADENYRKPVYENVRNVG